MTTQAPELFTVGSVAEDCGLNYFAFRRLIDTGAVVPPVTPHGGGQRVYTAAMVTEVKRQVKNRRRRRRRQKG